MPQVTVWQCPRTAKLFVEKADYVRHLKRKARAKIRERNKKLARARSLENIQKRRAEVFTFEDLGRYIVECCDDAYRIAANRAPTPSGFKITSVEVREREYYRDFENSVGNGTADFSVRFIYNRYKEAGLTQGWRVGLRFECQGGLYDVNSRGGSVWTTMLTTVAEILEVLGLYSHDYSGYPYFCLIDDGMFPGITAIERLHGDI